MSGLGIDLGTANTVVCHPAHGIVLNEPSVIVLRGDRRRRPGVFAVGHEARALVGRTPADLKVVRPLHDGVITDLETARTFIVAMLRMLAPHRWQRMHLQAVIGVPGGASVLERRALLEAAEEAGIRRVTLIPEPIAGAMGCGLNPLGRRAHMVVDVGGGTAEVTAFCVGGILAHRSIRVAGGEMTLAIYHHLRERYQLVVGELDAEEVKIRAAEDENSLIVEGRDAATGRPRLVTIPAAEIGDAVRPVTDAIMQALATSLDDLPAQSVGDVMSEGVVVFGGGSLLRGFDGLVESTFGFSVKRAAQPLTCVAEGAARCLANQAIIDAFAG